MRALTFLVAAITLAAQSMPGQASDTASALRSAMDEIVSAQATADICLIILTPSPVTAMQLAMIQNDIKFDVVTFHKQYLTELDAEKGRMGKRCDDSLRSIHQSSVRRYPGKIDDFIKAAKSR